MSERLVSRSLFLLTVATSIVWLGCGPSKAPLSTGTPLAKDVPKLMQLLESKSRADRFTAANYLRDLGASGELGEEKDKVLAKLQELAKKDKEVVVKEAAAEAVAKIQGGGS